jgi:hypothetical protein
LVLVSLGFGKKKLTDIGFIHLAFQLYWTMNFWTIVFLDTGSFGFSDIDGLIMYQSTSGANIQ